MQTLAWSWTTLKFLYMSICSFDKSHLMIGQSWPRHLMIGQKWPRHLMIGQKWPRHLMIGQKWPRRLIIVVTRPHSFYFHSTLNLYDLFHIIINSKWSYLKQKAPPFCVAFCKLFQFYQSYYFKEMLFYRSKLKM